MQKTFLLEKIPMDCETAVYATHVTIIPSEDQIIFTVNTRHCYKGLISFFRIALNNAVDEKSVRPNYTIIENDEQNVLTIQGDCEYVIIMCKDHMFDDKTVDDMLYYLRNTNQPNCRCTIL